jgi:hypothetical protein
MTKTFRDALGSSREPVRPLGAWDDWQAFESTSIYMTHLVRLERAGKVRFVYDPGRVYRHLRRLDIRLSV